MTNKKLNMLAVTARSSSDAMWQIKHQFSPLIRKISEDIRNAISSQESFENECEKQIEYAVRNYREGYDIKPIIVRNIHRVAKKHRSRFEKRLVGYEITPMTLRDKKTGKLKELPIVDVLADVGQSLNVKEIIRLAPDDSRKFLVLGAWMSGNYNDSEISTLLAKRFGGNPESHRKFITRFRTKCRKTLLDFAV